MTQRNITVVVIAGAALLLASCAPTPENATDAEAAQASGKPPAKVATQRPGPFVIRFVQDVRDGAGPAVLSDYDQSIVNRVGARNALGAIDTMATLTAGTQPRIARHRLTKAGELIVVSLVRTPRAASTRYSFVVRRGRGGWKILYDSLLAQGLQTYMVAVGSPDPAKPSARSARNAAHVLSALRFAALPRSVRSQSVPQRTARPAAKTTGSAPARTSTTASG
jgi:hypothetical protein